MAETHSPLTRAVHHINIVLIAAIVCAVLACAALLFWAWIFNTRGPDIGCGEELITIERGMSLRTISEILARRRLVKSATALRLAARISGIERRLLPGDYSLPHGLTNAQIIRLLKQPMIRSREVTIPESLTSCNIAGILQHSIGCDSTDFMSVCEDSEFAWQLGVPAPRLEGYLFPDTYEFYFGAPPRAAAEKMVKRFFELVDSSFQARMLRAGMTLHQTTTLASIIEGEVQLASEAPLVSAVYHNRLKKRMALEADPTIQYIISDGPRRLRRSDLLICSPYNTYLNSGLPPGPINNPGFRSLQAAIEPAQVDYLYFVSQGDGSHAFNKDYSGHLKSKQKLDELRRELEREKQAQG